MHQNFYVRAQAQLSLLQKLLTSLLVIKVSNLLVKRTQIFASLANLLPVLIAVWVLSLLAENCQKTLTTSVIKQSDSLAMSR